MLAVTSIDNGIVIDHIKAGLGIKLFHYLKLDHAKYPVALISNVASKKLGQKDIIKIQSLINMDFNKLSLIDPNITVNIIENGKTRKNKLTLPEQVEGVMICKNPRCITSIEKQIPHIFKLVDQDSPSYKCVYCEDIQNRIEL